jgi:hypothetical protein
VTCSKPSTLALLCLSALTIAWFAVFVVYKLFKGQR